jgi:hypothetical protein
MFMAGRAFFFLPDLLPAPRLHLSAAPAADHGLAACPATGSCHPVALPACLPACPPALPCVQSVEVVSVPLDVGDRSAGYAVLRFQSAAHAQRHYDKWVVPPALE